MTFNFQWCKKHRKPNPRESVMFCPGCTLESVDEAARFRKALEQIRDMDDSGMWTDFSITLQHIASAALKG